MNKKIVKALFSGVVAKDSVRPLLQGVHFTEEECVATDTRVLVVYKETNPALAGRTILPDGSDANEGKGQYPNWTRVFPKAKGTTISIDWRQLNRALKWMTRQPDKQEYDRVVVGEMYLSMAILVKLLSVFEAAGELGSIVATSYDPARPMKLESESLKGIIMPTVPEPEKVDAPREDTGSIVMSYANLINTFAIESTKPKEAKVEMAWL